MTPRTQLFIWAACFGLLAGVVVFFVAVAPQQEKNLHRIAFADEPIPRLTRLSRDMIDFRRVEEAHVPDRAVYEPDLPSIIGRPARHDIKKGEVLRLLYFQTP